MFSPRLFAVCAFLATVAAVPVTDQPAPLPITSINSEDINDSPWLTFPIFGNLFAPLWKLFPTFADIGPRIISDDDKFQVVVNVKDYNKDDLKVKLKNDFIFIQGSHEAKKDDRDIFASQFFHTYTMPSNSSSDDVTAELTSDGNLIVTAPVSYNPLRSKEVDREVPIVETGKPYKEEKPEIPAVQPAVPAVAEEEDKKEPTTPSSSDREDVTEKDNVIPHGNEVSV